jgi:hypothetical protein
MKLVSIINAWADAIELMPFLIKNHLQFSDEIIVVWSQYSNHGAKSDAILEYILTNGGDYRVHFTQLEPISGSPLLNETRKRNHGIGLAQKNRFTHFIICDLDEFYIPSEMNKEKRRFENPILNGLVHPLKVYIKTPTLWCDDHTLVPGITKLNGNTSCGAWPHFPFAYDKEGRAHIDPSRRLSYTNGIERSEAYMHHFSYVRKNIDLKIDNSSANLRRSRQVIYDELRDAKPGYVSKLYHQHLKESENLFNICI